MNNRPKELPWTVLTILSFVSMIVMNVLANVLPINGQTTKEVSDYYNNLFTPSSWTFSIWGIIYLLLFAFVYYQWKHIDEANPMYHKIRVFFIFSCLANILWIIAWHYQVIWLSLIWMIGLMIALGFIMINLQKMQLTRNEKWCLRLPFSVYFGWITVALIANVTTFLVSIGFEGNVWNEADWTVFILIIGSVISVMISRCLHDIIYEVVVVWAYSGILIRHVSVNGFNNLFPMIAFITIACIVFQIYSIVYYAFYLERKKGVQL